MGPADPGNNCAPWHRRLAPTSEEALEHIGWHEWFQKLEAAGLAFLYQEQKASGEDSTFFKLVNR